MSEKFTPPNMFPATEQEFLATMNRLFPGKGDEMTTFNNEHDLHCMLEKVFGEDYMSGFNFLNALNHYAIYNLGEYYEGVDFSQGIEISCMQIPAEKQIYSPNLLLEVPVITSAKIKKVLLVSLYSSKGAVVGDDKVMVGYIE